MKSHYYLAFIILLFASFLRLSHPDLVLFDGDESRDLFRTMALVEKGAFPGLGSELITGGSLGPLEYYVLAIPFLISSDPAFLTTSVTILNIMAVFMLFIFCRDFFNMRTALIASALFAFSPAAVVFSKKVWNPYFLPLCTIIFFYALFKVKIHLNKKYILAALPAYACMIQFHISAVFLFPFVLVLFSKDLFKRELIKLTLSSFIIVFILFLPLLTYEFSHEFSNTKNIISGTGRLLSNKKMSLNDKAAGYFAVAMSNVNYIPHNSTENQCLQTEYKGNMLSKSEILLFLLAIIYISFIAFFKKRDEIFIYLLAWYFLPLILFFIMSPLITNHYLIIQYPVQFVIIAILLGKIASLSIKWNKRNIPLSVLVVLYITVLSISQTQDIYKYYNSVGEKGLINCFGLNIALKQKLAIVNSIVKDSNNNQYVYENNVYGCEDFPGAGGYNELIGGFDYLFEVQKRNHELRNEPTDRVYAFLMDIAFDEIPAKEEHKINRYIKWYKFTDNREFHEWEKNYDLNCNSINKQTEQARKNIHIYKRLPAY